MTYQTQRSVPKLNRKSAYLIDGMLSSKMTVLAGDPKAGKSHLTVAMAAALVEGKDSFLGHEINSQRRPQRVAFGVTDPDGVAETAGRLDDLISDPDQYLIGAVRDDGRTTDYWERHTKDLLALDIDLFVLDNVLGALPPDADISRSDSARKFLDSLDALMTQGIAVLLVTHTAKTTYEGRGSAGASAPIGGRLFGARPRATLHLMKSEKNGRRLRIDTNSAEDVKIPLGFQVRNEAPVWSVLPPKEKSTPKKRKVETYDQRRKIASQVIESNPPERSLRELARRLAGELPGGMSEHTLRSNLGSMIHRQNGVWAWKACPE